MTHRVCVRLCVSVCLCVSSLCFTVYASLCFTVYASLCLCVSLIFLPPSLSRSLCRGDGGQGSETAGGQNEV